MRKKPKLVLFPTRKVFKAIAGETVDDFATYASYRISSGGLYEGTLKVVRKTDGRVLFPFEGADPLGPFANKEAAIEAAHLCAERIIVADLANPEG
jgi:hypothetical protein